MNLSPFCAPPPAPEPGRLHAAAARRVRARLAGAAVPWLHGEAARRMAERLLALRQPPRRVLDASLVAGGARPLLAPYCPQLSLERVLPGGATPAQAAFDMVWSVLTLHWHADPLVPLAAWRQALAPGGFVMFSTFGRGTLEALRGLYRAAGWGLAMAALPDMHDLGDVLAGDGWADPVMDQETLRLTWSSPEAALAELRTLGGNAAPQRFAGWRTPRWRARLLAALAQTAGPDGRVALDFELVYGCAYQGAAARPALAGETHIGLAEMRAMLRRGG